ncbi:MAG: glycosyltransferase [Fidelibacterota bacterium]
MLIFLLFLSLALYAFAVLFFATGLLGKASRGNSGSPTVTVVIPAKNEKDHMERILTEVTHQTYPGEKTEIIIVDDESTDITPNIGRAFADRYDHVRLLSTEGLASRLRFKKRPLDLGIREATGEIILLTDADCHVSSTWIETMVSYFQPDVGMVIGHSETRPVHSQFERIQALDFLLLMAAARGAARWNQPFGCTGQNLAYRKEVYEDVGGFSRFARAVGGDDTLLLQQVKHRSPWRIVFATDPASVVSSPPVSSLRQYLSQRLRWASDSLWIPRWDPLLFSLLVIIFLANFLPLVIGVSLLWNPAALLPWVKGIGAKFVAEGLFVLFSTQVFRKKELRPAFPVWFITQIPYVVSVGLLLLLGNRPHWGGRQP